MNSNFSVYPHKCRFILFILLSLFSISSSAQEFSFNMFFTDAAGNKDTITLGFDPSATDAIDIHLGETNIVSSPINGVFDVRVTDEWISRQNSQIAGTFHTKKQYIKKMECDEPYSINCIDIYTENWPVTAKWDSTLFNNDCINYSLLTGVNPGGWWDTPGFVAFLSSRSSVTFLPTDYPGSTEWYYYINNSNDTIYIFWNTFGNQNTIFSSIPDRYANSKLIGIYPNPVKDDMIVENYSGVKIVKIQLLSGTSSIDLEQFDRAQKYTVSSYPKGLYIARFLLENGMYVTKKIILL
ncbi:MAG: T9SS type A sorting domain-containing protein [Bacteroidales bacterium]|nr:T9SS type A sorting domain-containing protein [Bacteroidales bacterium]